MSLLAQGLAKPLSLERRVRTKWTPSTYVEPSKCACISPEALEWEVDRHNADLLCAEDTGVSLRTWIPPGDLYAHSSTVVS